jgi:CheY-like chemotaxis protein
MISHELKTPLSDYLESIGDSRTCLKDGKEGLEPIKKEGHNYDAIILDLAMPDISGYDVLESLKNEGMYHNMSKNLSVHYPISDRCLSLYLFLF